MVKNVFQCFWSDPQTRVFECFLVSLCILDGKNVFSVFGQTQKHDVFLSVFLRGSVLFLPSRVTSCLPACLVSVVCPPFNLYIVLVRKMHL